MATARQLSRIHPALKASSTTVICIAMAFKVRKLGQHLPLQTALDCCYRQTLLLAGPQ
jgi:hypothetical protein